MHFPRVTHVNPRGFDLKWTPVFADFVSCISDTMPAEKAIVEEMLVYQESLKPETDIQYIVQQYCVGGYTPTPILYVNYNNGIARGKCRPFHICDKVLNMSCRSDIRCATGRACSKVREQCPKVYKLHIRSYRQRYAHTKITKYSRFH